MHTHTHSNLTQKGFILINLALSKLLDGKLPKDTDNVVLAPIKVPGTYRCQ